MNLTLLIIVSALLLVILLFFLFKLFGAFLPFVSWGALYVPTSKERVKKIIEFANVKPGDKVIDLGSGDGRLLVAFAKAGAKAYGYEINPVLVKKSKDNITRADVKEKATVYLGSFWGVDLSDFDIIIIYGMRHVMRRLEKKINKEAKKGTRIISNTFTFPTLPKTKEDNDVYLYTK